MIINIDLEKDSGNHICLSNEGKLSIMIQLKTPNTKFTYVNPPKAYQQVRYYEILVDKNGYATLNEIK